ncbi:hypothetical protein TNCV_4612201 [Trichonephila clavipes]|nr:hypothetical protein TNCV_4612201 [Trichonephila clavipes]
MPPNTLRVHTDFHAEIVEVEIEVVSPSIVPSGNFAELNRADTCMVLKDRRLPQFLMHVYSLAAAQFIQDFHAVSQKFCSLASSVGHFFNPYY